MRLLLLFLLCCAPFQTAFCQDSVTLTVLDTNNDLYSVAVQDNKVWCGANSSVVVFDRDNGSYKSAPDFNRYLLAGPIKAIGIDGSETVWARTSIMPSITIAMYNGNEWTESPKTLNIDINSMFTDSSGTLWMGSNTSGAFAIRGDSVQTYNADKEFLKISDIATALDGSIWCSSSQGVMHFIDGSWVVHANSDGNAIKNSQCIAVGGDGIVWAGTSNGLLRFDGTSWKRFLVADNIINSHINDIVIDHTGNVWVATDGGVSKYDGSSWTSYTEKAELIDNMVTGLAVDNKGWVWLCFARAERGIASFNGTEWVWYTTFNTNIPTNAVTSIAADNAGSVWMGCDDGLIQYDGSSWASYSVKDGLKPADIASLYAAPDNTLWIVYSTSTPAGITRYDGHTFTTYTSNGGYPDDNFRAISYDGGGSLWLAGSSGIHRLDGDTWTSYPGQDRLFTSAIYDVAESPDGVHWFATGEGLSRFDGVSWYTYSRAEGLTGTLALNAVEASPSGEIWCLTDSLALVSFDGGAFHYHTSPADSTPHPFDITMSKEGVLWGIASSDNRVFRFDGSVWKGLPPSLPELDDASYRDIVVDSDNVVWIASDRGLVKVKNGVWDVFIVEGPESQRVYDIVVDEDNIVWFAGDNCTSCYDGVSWKHWKGTDFGGTYPTLAHSIAVDHDNVKWFYTVESGVLSYDGKQWQQYNNDNIFPLSSENDCAVDKNNVKWFLSLNHGVFSYDGREWRSFKKDIGLPVNLVTKMFIDSLNRKWFLTTGSGLLCYDDEQWKYLTKDDGFITNYLDYIAEDSRGRIWVASQLTGLSVLDSEKWTHMITADKWLIQHISSLVIDKNDTVWIISNNGLLSFDGENWHNYSVDGTAGYRYMNKLIVDRHNKKWIIGYPSIITYDDETWESHNLIDSSFFRSWSYDVSAVDYSNTIWFTVAGLPACVRPTTAEIHKEGGNTISLIGNYPNPFNSGTIIDFEIQSWGMVGVTVYNIMGQAVRHIPPRAMPVGKSSIGWDGRNDSGAKVSSGVYLYRIEKNGREATGRMMFLK